MIDVKPLKPKALSPILVTEIGIVIDFKPLQLEKAPFPILVTLNSVSFTFTNDGIEMSPLYLLYHYTEPIKKELLKSSSFNFYLVSDVKLWNNAKKAELLDRVKHTK